jgi:hypothetical protein
MTRMITKQPKKNPVKENSELPILSLDKNQRSYRRLIPSRFAGGRRLQDKTHFASILDPNACGPPDRALQWA